jgi:hypothetical protein
MSHQWVFLPATGRGDGDESVAGVVIVCSRCGVIRSASQYEERIDLSGECPADYQDRQVRSGS